MLNCAAEALAKQRGRQRLCSPFCRCVRRAPTLLKCSNKVSRSAGQRSSACCMAPVPREAASSYIAARHLAGLHHLTQHWCAAHCMASIWVVEDLIAKGLASAVTAPVQHGRCWYPVLGCVQAHQDNCAERPLVASWADSCLCTAVGGAACHQEDPLRTEVPDGHGRQAS